MRKKLSVTMVAAAVVSMVAASMPAPAATLYTDDIVMCNCILALMLGVIGDLNGMDGNFDDTMGVEAALMFENSNGIHDGIIAMPIRMNL